MPDAWCDTGVMRDVRILEHKTWSVLRVACCAIWLLMPALLSAALFRWFVLPHDSP